MDDDFKELIDPEVLKLWYLANFKDFDPSDTRFSINDILANLDMIPKVKVFMMSVDEKEEHEFINRNNF